MAREARTKIRESQGRHTLYLPQDLINDSAFPFTVGEELVVRVVDGRLVAERTRQGKVSGRGSTQ